MNSAKVNDSLVVEYPDGFREMSEEELRQAYQDENSTRWGVMNEESHMVFCIYWHKGHKIYSALADSKSINKSTQTKLSKMLENNGYKLLGYRGLVIDGVRCTSFRHTYVLQDITYISDVTTMKVGTVCYTIYCYTRQKCEEANRDTLEAMLRSIKVR